MVPSVTILGFCLALIAATWSVKTEKGGELPKKEYDSEMEEKAPERKRKEERTEEVVDGVGSADGCYAGYVG